MRKPKGLRLFDRDTGDGQNLTLNDADTLVVDRIPGTVALQVSEGMGLFDADQLDKLAVRCKEWAKYLRSSPAKKAPPKKWEDL